MLSVAASMWALPLLQKAVGFLCFGLVATFIWHYLKRPLNAPPGPRGLPLIGSLLSLGTRPDIYLKGLLGTYGPVMGVYLGSKFAVVLGDFESTKEAFLKQGDVFSSRPRYPFFEKLANTVFQEKLDIYHGRSNFIC